MESNIEVIGNESSVIYYNLNKQLSNIKKIIVTKEIILGSFENNSINELLYNLTTSNSQEDYDSFLKDAKREGILDENINNDLYKTIVEQLPKISQGMMDIKLKDFNFMNSVSNSKFNITLRTENFSITKYFEEKGQIISSIRALLKDYINFGFNYFRKSSLENFQIEIYEADEIYKHVFLKKDGSSLLLSSTYGFPFQNPVDYGNGSEFYISQGEDFNFYKNKQSMIKIREHGRLTESEMREQEKILSNDELVMINETTKNMNDVIIEMIITRKGALKILNLSLPEQIPNKKSQNGFVIYKSSNNYDKVALVTLRENLQEDQVNPTYLLIRNENEIKELFSESIDFERLDGIVFTKNFYSPIVEEFGRVFNIDIIYWSMPLSKSLEATIDWEDFKIDTPTQKSSESNPFNQIIKDQSKDKDEFLERLKNVDLSTPSNQSDELNQRSEVGSMAQSIISSPNSASNSGGSNMFSQKGLGSNEKKSAIGMLADSVISQGAQPKREESKTSQDMAQQVQSQTVNMQTSEQVQNNPNAGNSSYGAVESQSTANNFNSMDDYFNDNSSSPSQGENNSNKQDNYMDFSDMAPKQESPIQSDAQNQNFDVNSGLDLGMSQNSMDYSKEQSSEHKEKQRTLDVDRYMEVLATKLLSGPNVNSGNYFVDAHNFAQVQGSGDIYFITTQIQNISNPNLNYVVPINLNNPTLRGCYLLINSANDYFLIDENQQEVKYFINLTHIDSSIKKKFLDNVISKLNKVSLIIIKEDLDLIKDSINKIEEVFVKDVQDESEYSMVKEKLLSFEKSYLMNK